MYIVAESSFSMSTTESVRRKTLLLIDGHPRDRIKGFIPPSSLEPFPLLAAHPQVFAAFQAES